MSASLVDSLYDLLNACQNSAHIHIRNAKKVWSLQKSHPDIVSEILLNCVEYAVGYTAAEVDRFLKFLGAFTHSAPPEDRTQVQSLFEDIIHILLSHLDVECKSERLRACTSLGSVLKNLPGGISFSNDLMDEFSCAIVKRLDDKCPKVRTEAVLALATLSNMDPDAVDDGHALNALSKLIAVEKSQVVRRAIIKSLPPVQTSADILMKHSKDESVEVRKAVYAVCRAATFSSILSATQRARLVATGMKDAACDVQQACSDMVASWYSDICGGNMLQLVEYTDASAQAGVACRMITFLMKSGQLNILDLMSNPPVATLKDHPDELIPVQVAFFWRLVCESALEHARGLQAASLTTGGTQAEHAAAEARQYHDVLEDTVPDADVLLGLIKLAAAAGLAHRTSALHLLFIATHMNEFADGSVRAASTSLVHDVMQQDPWLDATQDDGPGGSAGEVKLAAFSGTYTWERAVCDFAMKACPEPQVFAAEMLQSLRSACEAWEVLSFDSSQGTDMEAPQARLTQALAWLSCIIQCLKDTKHFGVEDASGLIRQGLLSCWSAARQQAICSIASWCMLSGAPSSPAFEECCVKVLEALQDDTAQVQEMAVKAVSNIIATHGVSVLDSACSQFRMEEPLTALMRGSSDAPPTASGVLLALLKHVSLKAEKLPLLNGKSNARRTQRHALTAGDTKVAVALVTGLQRLIMYQYKWADKETSSYWQDVDEQAVMLAMLLLKWDALPSVVTDIQHMNQGFWNVYSSCSPLHQLKLCRLFIPAVTLALQQPEAKANMAAEVTSFLTTLLTHEPKDDIGVSGDCPLPQEAERLVLDLFSLLVLYTTSDSRVKARLKPLASNTLKALQSLPMQHCTPDTVNTMHSMAEYLKHNLQERMLNKEVSQLLARLMLLPHDQDGKLDVNEVEGVVEQRFQEEHMKSLVQAIHAEHPGSEVPQRVRPTYQQRKKAPVSESSSDEDEPAIFIPAPVQAPVVQPRRSTRAAAQAASAKMSTRTVVKLESSEESDGSASPGDSSASLESDEE